MIIFFFNTYLLHLNLNVKKKKSKVRTLFLLWLPWILRMSRPGSKVSRKTLLMNSRMKEMELKERSSRSLLANVLDMDDDFRTVSSSAYSHYNSNTSRYGTGANSASMANFPTSASYNNAAAQDRERHRANIMSSNMQQTHFGSRSQGFAIDEEIASSTTCLQVRLYIIQ